MNKDSIINQVQQNSGLIETVQSNTQFAITAFLTTLGIAIAIAGGALFLLARRQVENGINRGLEKAKEYYGTHFDDLENQLRREKEKIKNLENYTERVEKEYELGDYLLSVKQNEKMISEHRQHYYRLRNMVIIEVDVFLDNFTAADDKVILDGLPLVPKRDAKALVSMTNREKGVVDCSSIQACLYRDSSGIELLISKPGIKTSNLLFSDLNRGTKITGKIIYEID